MILYTLNVASPDLSVINGCTVQGRLRNFGRGVVLQISWNDLLHQGQTADVSIIRAKTGTFSIETLDVHLAPRWGLVWFDKIFQACQGPTSHSLWERFGDIWVFPCFSQWWFFHVDFHDCRGVPRLHFTLQLCSIENCWKQRLQPGPQKGIQL
jgi:hypothetical protein